MWKNKESKEKRELKKNKCDVNNNGRTSNGGKVGGGTEHIHIISGRTEYGKW